MPTLTRKVTLYPVGDDDEVNRVYTYIRDGMEVQSYMMNLCISAMYTALLNGVSMQSEEFKELRRVYGRIPTSKKESAYSFNMEKYPTGLGIASKVPMVCQQKIKKSIKDGLMCGKVSLPTYKKTMPLYVRNNYINIIGLKDKNVGLYHNYDTPMDLVVGLRNEKDPKIFIKFVNNIEFKIVFGSLRKSQEIRSVFEKIFSGEYKICDSSIGFGKKTGKKIELNLSLEIPKADNIQLDENICVGVDLGMAIPAMCALNNNLYTRCSIGNYDEFTGRRTKIQAQRRRIQQSTKYSKGGHGRKRKLAHLEKMQLHEREFAKTYNHMVSKRVIDFALKNHAKYINIEDLSSIPKERKDEFVLRNWSYYELQQMIKYKAAKYGIIVRKVDPAYTSQRCSVCGEIGERKTQSEFRCINPDCKCHKIYDYGFNADFNAARNISQSTDFTEIDGKQIKRKEERKEEKVKKGRKYKQASELKEEIA